MRRVLLAAAFGLAGCDLSYAGLYVACDGGNFPGATCVGPGGSTGGTTATGTAGGGGSSTGLSTTGASSGGGSHFTSGGTSAGNSTSGTGTGSTGAAATTGGSTSGGTSGGSTSGSVGSSSSSSSSSGATATGGTSSSGGSTGAPCIEGGTPAGSVAYGVPDWSPSWLTLLAGTPDTRGSTLGAGDLPLFDELEGLASDGAGHLFVADDGNDVIREIDLATGAVTTIAGQKGVAGSADGIGTQATFSGPDWLAYNPAGFLYIADGSNATIRQMDLSSGKVTTVAGTLGDPQGCEIGNGLSAGFDGLGALAFDGNHTLYVAVTFCFGFVALDTNSWNETLVAGQFGGSPCGYQDGTTAQSAFSYAGAVAYVNGSLYTADSSASFCTGVGDTLRRIDLDAGTVSTVAGAAGQAGSTDAVGTAARFNVPEAVVYDGVGNLYVGDGNNQTIRKVALPGYGVTTVAGDVGVAGSSDGVGATAQFDSLAGLAVGGGDLFAADFVNQEIREYFPDGGLVTTVAGSLGVTGSADSNAGPALLDKPIASVFDGVDTLYVTDSGDHTIKAIDVQTGAVSLVSGTPGVSAIQDGANPTFIGPNGLAYDGNGHLFVTDGNDSEVTRLLDLASGVVTTVVGTAGQGGCALGTGAGGEWNAQGQLAYDGNGHLYVANTFCFDIVEVDTCSWTQTLVAGSNNGSDTCAYKDGPALQAQFSYAGAFAADFSASAGAGILYIVDSGAPFCSGVGGTVRKLDLNTMMVSTIAGSAGVTTSKDGVGAAAGFHFPGYVAYDGLGSLFIQDGDSTVRMLNLATDAVTTVLGTHGSSGVVLGPAPGGLEQPSNLLVAPGPTLYVPDSKAAVVFMAR